MNDNELIYYFDNNIETIFTSSDFNEKIDFLSICLDDTRVKNSIKTWPDDIKIKIVKSYLTHEDIEQESNSNLNSWSDYYEMYDGKFDETNMLHITIDKINLSKIIELGYELQDEHESWHKPLAGQYKFDDDGNIIIIHSCPDREIFGGDLKQHLEELGLKYEWAVSTTLSVM